MTVKAIRLENFMAFADTGWIELRPITLLFGRNSSGKSAIIRALRLLRQNLERPTLERPTDDHCFTLRFNSEYGVALGDYREIVHGQDTSRVMRFHFRCDAPIATDIVRREINQWRQQNDLSEIIATREDTLTLALAFGYDSNQEAELIGIDISCNWQITAEPGSHTLLSAVGLDRQTREEVGYNWWLDTDLPSWQALDWERTSFTFPQNFLPQLVDSPTGVLPNALGNLAQSITTFLEGIEYQPPIRPEPQREYVLKGDERQQWRRQGWGAFMDFLEGKLDDEKLIRIDKCLQYLELGEQILQPVKKYPDRGIVDKDTLVAAIEIEEQESKLKVNLKNVGFGASQVIPVIVQSVTARQRVLADSEGRVLGPRHVVIEQPELHLHPRAQALLADLFVEEIRTPQIDLEELELQGEQAEAEHKSSGVSFLLETHSEHLLLRFLRRLAETSLLTQKKNPYHRPPLFITDLSLIYVERNWKIGESNCEAIVVNEMGEYVQQPAGFVEFFGEDFSELLAIGQVRAEWAMIGQENDSPV